MKQKHNRKTLKRYAISASMVLIIAAATFAVAMPIYGTHDAAASEITSQLPQKTPGPPQFSFNSSRALGWSQGPTDKVSMALFHTSHDCFVSVQRRAGSIAADKAKRQETADYLIGNGYVIKPGGTKRLAIQTPAGPQYYQLHQSTVITPKGAHKIKGGQEFGYLSLSDIDFVFIEGYCDAPGQLPVTIPALQAIRLNGTN